MERWRKVWREGFAPQFSKEELTTLRTAIATDDERLLQGATTMPAASLGNACLPCTGACLIGFAGFQHHHMQTVGEVDSYFATKAWKADQRMNEPAMCRHLLNWFDETHRDEVRREMLAEIDLILRNLEGAAPCPPSRALQPSPAARRSPSTRRRSRLRCRR